MWKTVHPRRPSAAMVVAVLALVLAMSAGGLGTAVAQAARLVTGHDVKNGSLTGRDIKTGSLTTGDVRNGSLTGSDLRAGSLALSKLSNSRGTIDTSVSSAIAIPAGGCGAQLTGNFGDLIIGDLVLATLTDANGNAVIPNSAAIVPTVVHATSQGGAVPVLLVCNPGAGTLTIPAGSVFHWRLVDH